jgi:cellulose synthase/poly-beta-1,6-N-acetylglucosamine synthase-like glycosyltransferase
MRVLFYLLAFANFISMLHLGMYMIGANMYDVLDLRRAAKSRKTANGSIYEPVYKPLVSVIIPAHNESAVIKRTLDSVRASSYDNFEIIVVDDGSTDRTDTLVREYIQRIPDTATKPFMRTLVHTQVAKHRAVAGRAQLPLVGRVPRRLAMRYFERVHLPVIRTIRLTQRNAGKAAAINNAIRNHARGELVMCLDADSLLHPKAIEHAVRYFKDPKVMGVAANVRLLETGSILGMVQRFEHMVGYRSKKFYSLTNSEYIVGGVASTYRMEALRKVDLYDVDTLTEDIGLSMKLLALQGNRGNRLVYAADVVAMTEGVETFKQLVRQRFRWKMGGLQNMFKYRRLILNVDGSKYSRMLTLYRLPMAVIGELMLIVQPAILAYVIYLTIHWHTLNLIMGSYVVITLYVLWTIWPDEHLSRKEKLRMSRWAIVIYGLFYIMDVVQIMAIFRCLKQFKKIIFRNAATTWISPTRIGQAVQM